VSVGKRLAIERDEAGYGNKFGATATAEGYDKTEHIYPMLDHTEGKMPRAAKDLEVSD
jgi:hypothetical protein